MIKMLSPIAHFLHEHLPHCVEHLTLLDTPPQSLKLYQAILENDFETDKEAIEKAGIGKRTSLKKYGQILFEKMNLVIQLVDSQKMKREDYNKARLVDEKKLTSAHFLSSIGCWDGASKLCVEILGNAKHFERVEHQMMASTILRFCENAMGAKMEFGQAISKEIRQYQTWVFVDLKAREYFEEANQQFRISKSYDASYLSLTESRINELKPYVGIIPSYMFHCFFYLLARKALDIQGKYQEYITHCLEAKAYFQSKPFKTGNMEIAINYGLIMAYTRTNNTVKAEKCITESNTLIGSNTLNYFSFLELTFYYYAQTTQLKKATEIYHKAVKDRRFKGIPDAKKERWTILGAYLYIGLMLDGHDPEALKLSKFRSAKFLNDIQILNADKGAMNAAVLMAHIIMQILEDKIDIVWERIDALQKYLERYLDGAGNERIKLAFSFLKDVARYAHDKEKLQEKTTKHLSDMAHFPYAVAQQPHEVEVLPYEWIAQKLLVWLQPRSLRPKKRVFEAQTMEYNWARRLC